MSVYRTCQLCGRKDWPAGTLDQTVDVCGKCLKASTKVASLLIRAEGFVGAARRFGLLPEKQALTRTERDALNIICEFIHHEGRSPTYEELRIELDFGSKNSVFTNVRKLIAKGWLWPREPKKKFSIRPVDEEWPDEPGDVELNLTQNGLNKVVELKAMQ